MHSVLERLVDSSLEDAASSEPGAPSSSFRITIQQEIDAGSGKYVYGWRDDSRDMVYDFLDSFGCPGHGSQPQIPFYTNLAM
mgnify:CR=1 FL=1